MNDEHFMRLAIEKAREGVQRGNAPFGACLVKNSQVLCLAHNRVWEDTDITAHAEIVAIKEACKKLDTIDLKGTLLYATCEPCPMCFSASHWARITKIIYGARIQDAKNLGFHELSVSNLAMKDKGSSEIQVEGPLLLEENLALFEDWLQKPDPKTY
jgi:tRNA(Arg) A34 adenosine deaminase TadA